MEQREGRCASLGPLEVEVRCSEFAQFLSVALAAFLAALGIALPVFRPQLEDCLSIGKLLAAVLAGVLNL